MFWPPSKAWTSKKLVNGLRHFVAINYGGQKEERWVVLVSVLDGKIVFVIPWSEMQNTSKWVSGWQEINTDNYSIEEAENQLTKNDRFVCLHPSQDSGLTIPLSDSESRPWY